MNKKRILSFLFCVMLLFSLVSTANAESSSLSDQLVNYGITCSVDGQYIPVFNAAGSKDKIALLKAGDICALDSMYLVSRYYWYKVVFFDENGLAQTGYLKESNFERLTTAALAQQMADPEQAAKIAQYIALAAESPVLSGTNRSSDSTALASAAGASAAIGKGDTSATTEKGTHYVLNTNTKKFHYPSCKSVDQMKKKNRKDFTGTRTEVIEMGYVPCKNCNP